MKTVHAMLTSLLVLGAPAGAQTTMTAAQAMSLEEYSQAGARALQPDVVRPDERRPEQPLTVTLFGRPTELGISYEGTFKRRNNFDLNSQRQRDREILEHEVKLDAKFPVSEKVTLFAQVIGTAESRKQRSDGSEEHQQALERGQTWVLIKEPAGLPISLQAGRIALIEPRSWWWDEDLDGARLNFASGKLRLETGLARELAPLSNNHKIDPEAKDVTRWFGEASYQWAPRHSVDAFWLLANDRSGAPAAGSILAADDEDASDGRLRWFGLRASGEARFESKHRLSYWLDAAIVRGSETLTSFAELEDSQLLAGSGRKRQVKGHAVDLGLKWAWPGAARPTITLGWASGSGGADGGTVDRNFRQTGLQENKGRMSGVKSINYYGRLLDPELSNLRIATLGAGVRFFNKSSAELLLHDYRQKVASTVLAGSRLSQDPAGTDTEIGREIDLLFALREWRHVEFTLLLSAFRPGAAFAPDRRDTAHAIEVGMELDF